MLNLWWKNWHLEVGMNHFKFSCSSNFDDSSSEMSPNCKFNDDWYKHKQSARNTALGDKYGPGWLHQPSGEIKTSFYHGILYKDLKKKIFF